MKNRGLVFVLMVSLLTGCATSRQASREERVVVGSHVGSFFGWLLGGIIGEATGGHHGADIGSAFGAVAGGVAGASIANHQYEQEQEARQSIHQKSTDQVSVQSPYLVLEDILLSSENKVQNKKIDAGETCKISLIILNNGFQDALQVEPIVRVIGEGKQYIKLSQPTKIKRITREDRVTYDVMLKASSHLPTGKIQLGITLQEGRGNGTSEEVITIETVGR